MRLWPSIGTACLAAALACATAAANSLPPIDPGCNASAVAPWPAAGEGYRAQAATEGEACAGAHLTLALVNPNGRAVWEGDFGGAAAVRVLYGVPGGREMERELEAWITQGGTKPQTSGDLPAWPEGAAGPEGFEPNAPDRPAYEALRAAKRPLFCFAQDPGFDTCLQLTTDDLAVPIGRRATR